MRAWIYALVRRGGGVIKMTISSAARVANGIKLIFPFHCISKINDNDNNITVMIIVKEGVKVYGKYVNNNQLCVYIHSLARSFTRSFIHSYMYDTPLIPESPGLQQSALTLAPHTPASLSFVTAESRSLPTTRATAPRPPVWPSQTLSVSLEEPP